jgi:TldD protein
MTFDPSLWKILSYGDYADLFWEDSRTLSIRWENGGVERLTGGRERGAGLRYLRGEECRYASLDDPDFPAIVALTKPLTQGLPSRPNAIKPQPLREFRPQWTQPLGDVSIDDKIALLEKAFKTASLPGVRQITMGYGESRRQIKIWTSDGTSSDETRDIVTFSVTVIAEKNGLLQTAYDSISGTAGFEYFRQRDVMALARRVAERAVQRLDAPAAPLGEMPVIVAASAGGTLIHEAIGHPLEADAVQKDVSPTYKGSVGKIVGNEKISVLEDPTMSGQRGFYAFDDEGVPAERLVLIDHGVLKTYIYDRQTAAKDGVRSNGHGRRESFHHRPIPRMANTFVAPGPDDPQMIVRSIPKGLLVTQMGGGQVEPATGDFVFEVEEGFLIKDGQVGPLIRSANLLGNGPDVLKNIDLVGTDMGWSVGTCGKDGQGAPVAFPKASSSAE